ncbi:hypothetical protein [Actinokineospora iranica]|uniref:Gluconate 2-dehydrogenase subunit 3 n=1 Tax=Actinokineospora iranica TaxID=1271860 RepID=A0A1G6S1M0_9PSEU|nr:hypothetical protein [Actinokineospora iranica]SDD10571.1 hypothetical protein SAMN05216174_107157 [Actinokineospora iranica]
MTGEGRPNSGISRRELLAGMAGVLAVAPFVGGASAEAVVLPPIRDTFHGLSAFLVPGRDRFSAHQGRTSATPGGVEAGTAAPLERTYDQAIPFPLVGRPFDLDLPGAAAIAAILNLTAVAVDPLAAVGPFAAAFANLSFERKAEVFARLERPGLADGTPVRFLINTIPTLAAFIAYSEAPVFDRATGRLTAVPVGWQLSGYDGVGDGWAEFQGYYRGIDRVTD